MVEPAGRITLTMGAIMGKHPPPWRKESFTPERQGYSNVWISIALSVAVLAVYLQCATFDFTRYDDNYFVTENPVVQQGLSFENMVWAVTAVQNGTWQPITWLTHMFDCQVFGLNAGGHHFVNVIFHLINTVLLCLLLQRNTSSVYPSAFVAALFALHPLHVESVAWVGERRDVLSTIWWILTMAAYARWVVRPGMKGYLPVIACFALGLMSKPMLVSLPVILLLFDIWPLQRVPVSDSGWSVLSLKNMPFVVEKVPLFLLALGMSIITMIAEGKEGALGSISQYPWSFRFENAVVTYVKYLILTIWPFGLIPHYPYPPSYPLWQVLGSIGVLLGISLYCIKNLARRAYLAVGWFWYLIAMFPVIGIVQQGSGFAMADRYSYVPLIGIFIMVAWGGKEIAEKSGWTQHAATIAVGVILLACGTLSFFQAGHWRDTVTLFSYTLAQSPGNHVALQQLGVEYRERGDYQQAYRYLAEDVRLNPTDIDALANFGQLLDKMGRLDDAILYHQKAIQINPGNFELYLNLGQILARKGELPAAQAVLRQALAMNPESLPALLNLGYTLYLDKQYEAAAAQFASALKREPATAEAYNGLGLVAMAQGRLDEATHNFLAALQINPGLQHAQENLQEIRNRQSQR